MFSTEGSSDSSISTAQNTPPSFKQVSLSGKDTVVLCAETCLGVGCEKHVEYWRVSLWTTREYSHPHFH